MSGRKPYPSDLTDPQWKLIEPVINAWKAEHPSATGHQGKYAMREIVNTILYQNRTRLSVGVPAARSAAEECDVLLLRRLA
jgi:transposase